MAFKHISIDPTQFNKLYANFWSSCFCSDILFDDPKQIKSLRNQYWKDNYGLYYNNSVFQYANYYSMKVSNQKKLDYARIKYGF